MVVYVADDKIRLALSQAVLSLLKALAFPCISTFLVLRKDF